MGIPTPENSVLASAFYKINYAPEGEVPAFTSAEIALLHEYVSMEPKEKARSESQQHFYEVVIATVNKLPSSAPEREHERRANSLLRVALHKCESKAFDTLNDAEVQLLMNTKDTLAAKSSPTANNTRLLGFLEEELTQIESMAAAVHDSGQKLAPISDEAIDASVCKEDTDFIPADEFFSGAEREQVDEISGIPIKKIVRVFEHTGNLFIDGEMPEDAVLVVRNGGVFIQGFMSGYIFADLNVNIAENVLGGYILSETGNIHAKKILSSSSLIAPRGSIEIQGGERPDTLYAAGRIHVAEHLKESRIYTTRLHVGGELHSAQVQVLHAVEANVVESSPQSKMTFAFRNLIHSGSFGRELTSDELTNFRHLARSMFQMQHLLAREGGLREDAIVLNKTAYYHLTNGNSELPDAHEMRVNANKRLYMGMVERMAFAFQRLIFSAIELNPESMKSILSNGIEECQMALKNLDKELVALPDSHFRKCEDAVRSSMNHLSIISKKIKESTVSGKGLPGQLKSLIKRQKDWLKEYEAADALYVEHCKILDETLDIPDESKRSATGIKQEVQKYLQAHPTRSDNRDVKDFMKVIEQRRDVLGEVGKHVAAIQEDEEAQQKALESSGAIVMSSYPPTYHVQGLSFSKDVHFTAVPDWEDMEALDTVYSLTLEKLHERPCNFIFEQHRIYEEGRDAESEG